MLYMVLIGVIGYFAYKNVPSQDSFRDYIKKAQGNESQSKWIPKFLRSLAREPAFDYQSYGLFSLVTIRRSGQVYLGLMNIWIPLSVPDGGDQQVDAQRGYPQTDQLYGVQVDGQIESLQQQAIDAKRSKQYKYAGDLYQKCAQLCLQTANRELQSGSGVEAASMYEDAYKCYKQSGDSHQLCLQSLLKAADLYEQYDRSMNRAGRCYDTLSDMQMNSLDQAILSLRKVVDCYQADDDIRAVYARYKLVNAYATTNRYKEAVSEIDDLMKCPRFEEAYKFRINEIILCSCLCTLGVSGQFIDFITKYQRMVEEFPAFDASREGQLCQDLVQAYDTSDSTEWTALVSAFYSLSPLSSKERWKIDILKSYSDKLDHNELT
ncbi:hypothetical protein MP228_005975 [Amoeboaphelidium protococcarum]|nr:hypothetical protein MP228_005975 [Amoeboaphelidium protococcarum]